MSNTWTRDSGLGGSGAVFSFLVSSLLGELVSKGLAHSSEASLGDLQGGDLISPLPWASERLMGRWSAGMDAAGSNFLLISVGGFGGELSGFLLTPIPVILDVKTWEGASSAECCSIDSASTDRNGSEWSSKRTLI